MTSRRPSLILAAALALLLVPLAAHAQFVTGLQGASGSTIGPDGALYVTEGAAGRISRVDPLTGEVTTWAEGLPPSLIGIGGAVDVAFLDGVAYALVTLVGADVGGTDTVGIYRVDGPSQFSVIADIGAFSIANPPPTAFFLPTGVQYAMDAFRGGFLVTDGHHNRVLRIRLDGSVSQFNVFGNIVPTGLEIHGRTIYMAELGPAPNDPEDGKVVAFRPGRLTPVEVAAGARMVVDVERGPGRKLYALAQGIWDGAFPGSPALPYTGSLLEVNADGTFTEIASGLNLPTSVQFIGNAAYIVSLAGEIWVIHDVSDPPFGQGD